MNIVYDLIRNSIAAVNQFGRTRFDGDITPILIQSYNVCLKIFENFFDSNFSGKLQSNRLYFYAIWYATFYTTRTSDGCCTLACSF